jgi:hypothetical protein
MKDKELRKERNAASTWRYIMPTIWEVMKQESNFCVTRMKYFHKHRRPSPRFIYNLEYYLIDVNHIKDKRDIKIVRKMKRW